ncbi:MAG: hypothetical protein K2Q03_04015 [Sphingobacteriaceae bacterium]|nr:hypothetical protein [Sphingobacteriaceae bacterium]
MNNKHVTITLSLDENIAIQLAQFVKRSTLDTFAQFVEPHLTYEEREQRAYQMQAGILAVGAALADAGYAPR